MTECPECGDEFASKRAVSRHRTETHNNPSEVEVYCSNCGEAKTLTRSKAERSENHFCNSECYGEWVSGENSPRWNSEEVECAWCGTEKEVSQKELDDHDRYFCDKGCMGEWQSENWIGTEHPKWKRNAKRPMEYGESWSKKKREFVEKSDDKCAFCGISQDETDVKLHVHHIIRPNDFDVLEKAHKQENLLRLCRSCHPKVEGMSIESQKQLKTN
jgi:hypothetical protein